MCTNTFCKIGLKILMGMLLNENRSGFTFHYGVGRVFELGIAIICQMKGPTGKEINQFSPKIVNNNTAG